MTANFHIPDGTPILSQDGSRILARFKRIQGGVPPHADPEVFGWEKNPRYPEITVDTHPDELLIEEPAMLIARRIFKRPAMQVWQADNFDADGSTAEDEWQAFFPPRMFYHDPADLNDDLRTAQAIKIALDNEFVHSTLHTAGLGDALTGRLKDYAYYLRERGIHKIPD